MAQLVEVRASMREVLSSTPAGPIGLLQRAIMWYKSAMLKGKLIIIPALEH